MKKLLLTATALFTAFSAQTATTPEQNRQNALAFYEMAFNQHKVKEETEKYIGAEYLQHNPTVKDGGQAFIDAFEPFLKAHPKSKAKIKRVVADGDLVMLHVHSTMDATVVKRWWIFSALMKTAKSWNTGTLSKPCQTCSPKPSKIESMCQASCFIRMQKVWWKIWRLG